MSVCIIPPGIYFMIKGVLVTFHKNKKNDKPGKCLDNYFANKIFYISGHRRVERVSI